MIIPSHAFSLQLYLGRTKNHKMGFGLRSALGLYHWSSLPLGSLSGGEKDKTKRHSLMLKVWDISQFLTCIQYNILRRFIWKKLMLCNGLSDGHHHEEASLGNRRIFGFRSFSSWQITSAVKNSWKKEAIEMWNVYKGILGDRQYGGCSEKS